MNTTPARTGGLSWIYVTRLGALPMGKLGLSIPGNSVLLAGGKWHCEHSSKRPTSQIDGAGWKSLGRSVPGGFWAEQFVCAELIPAFSWSSAQPARVIHIQWSGINVGKGLCQEGKVRPFLGRKTPGQAQELLLIFVCVWVVGEMGERREKAGVKVQITWNQFSLSST